MRGIVTRMMQDKGFGFIAPSDGSKALFFHFSNCVGKVETFDTLTEGAEVDFEVQEGQKGPMAVDVELSGEDEIRSTPPRPSCRFENKISAPSNDDIERARHAANDDINKDRLKLLLKNVHADARAMINDDAEFAGKFFGNDFSSFVFSADIRMSTDLMLRARSTSEYSSFITSIISDLERIIIENNGVLEKFTGDGILSFFPDFFSGPDAGYFAAKAAAECHEAFTRVYKKHRHIFTSVPLGAGLGVGIDAGFVRLATMVNQLALVGRPVVYACRMAGAPSGMTYLNQGAHNMMAAKYRNVIYLDEMCISVKNEGNVLAHSITRVDGNYKPHHPIWRRQTPVG